jgi:hypothetical protein
MSVEFVENGWTCFGLVDLYFFFYLVGCCCRFFCTRDFLAGFDVGLFLLLRCGLGFFGKIYPKELPTNRNSD